ncbi:MAG TPA: Gfo/Idh/MocA family oxidoreductase [Spirochaetia bacterium]|nr:Gfo/Idh/MocA family oxidoreductase [Spirochaetia bacterium]
MPSVPLRAAFLGFRHPHVWDAFQRLQERPDVEVVACCEEDPATRESLKRDGKVTITHTDHAALLAEVETDFVVVGDFYGARGRLVADSLRAARHVLTDKPLCTRLSEYQEIAALAGPGPAGNGRPVLGMMLDMRDSGNFRALRDLVRQGAIGDAQAISMGGQHPLLRGTRPAWYHEKDRHGGTINDIAIHGVDAIRWITGREFDRVLAARAWRGNAPESSAMKSAAQCMLTLDNGCGVLADVSYLSPDSHRYTLPLYWRMTLWGTRGVIETANNASGVTLYQEGKTSGEVVPPAPAQPGGYLESFLSQVRGSPIPDALTPAEVLRASYIVLKTQEAADRGLTNVDLRP